MYIHVYCSRVSFSKTNEAGIMQDSVIRFSLNVHDNRILGPNKWSVPQVYFKKYRAAKKNQELYTWIKY